MCKANKHHVSRRRFLGTMAGIGSGLLLTGISSPTYHTIDHPEPRPDIDASLVIDGQKLAAFPEYVQKIYNQIREIPHIADGLGCGCGCAARPNYRSLLTCYYAEGMAMGCEICQGEAKLAYRRVQEGQNLEQIRRAIDARFG